MKKRILSFILLIALLCALPCEVVLAAPAEKPTIEFAINALKERVDAKFTESPSAEPYFTDNHKQCQKAGGTSSEHNNSNCYRYRLFNRCVGFARYATAILYGDNTFLHEGTPIGYNFSWGNTVYFDKIGTASVDDSDEVINLLSKAKKGDVVEVIRASSGYNHAMIFLSNSGTTSFNVYHANWAQNCNIAYNQSVNFTVSKYSGATISIYHSKNYEYLYGDDGLGGTGGPVGKPTIKLDSTIKIVSVDNPNRTSIGVRMAIENPSYLYLEYYGLQYRKIGDSTFNTVRTTPPPPTSSPWGKGWSSLYMKADGLAEHTNYEFRAFARMDGQTLYSGITKPYLTAHIHKENGVTICPVCGEYMPAALDMIIGGTQTLAVNVPNPPVTWSSSNTKVAKVDKNGKVTAVGTGKATIKATSDGKTAGTSAVTVHQYVTMRLGKTIAIQNGKKTSIDNIGTKPFLISGRTMLPLRFVGEKMGGKVLYKSDSQPITLTYGNTKVEFRLGNKQMKVTTGSSSKTITLDVAAQKVGAKTYIPLRAIGQALGFDVYYEAGTEYIVVNNPKMTPAVRDARLAEARKVIK